MRHVFLVTVFVAVVTVVAIASEPTIQAEQPTVIYLVRHAEKVDDSSNPELSAKGYARASSLARMLRDVSFDVVLSTDFMRTRSTVAGIAKKSGRHLMIYHPNDDSLSKAIGSAGGGKTFLVCGHSNTIPAFLAKLGVPISEKILSGYDDLFVLTITTSDSNGRLYRLDRLHYSGG